MWIRASTGSPTLYSLGVISRRISAVTRYGRLASLHATRFTNGRAEAKLRFEFSGSEPWITGVHANTQMPRSPSSTAGCGK
jgi:hypothetical protein